VENCHGPVSSRLIPSSVWPGSARSAAGGGTEPFGDRRCTFGKLEGRIAAKVFDSAVECPRVVVRQLFEQTGFSHADLGYQFGDASRAFESFDKSAQLGLTTNQGRRRHCFPCSSARTIAT
jgi:hypothetical protein